MIPRILYRIVFCLVLIVGWPLSIGLSAATADQEMVEEVYGNLKRAIGDLNANWPSIKVWSVKNRVAAFVPSDHTIYLDAEAVAACQEFGNQTEDALAFIIGHEVTHFYQQHKWKTSGFASFFLLPETDFSGKQDQERQADVYGGFIALQAGYEPTDVIIPLLEKIYQRYQLPKTATINYPSLQERIALARQSKLVAKNLYRTYQTANYLLLIGKYQEAYQLFAHVNQQIKSEELYNNLGVCLLKSALSELKPELSYPIGIDTRLPITRSPLEGLSVNQQLHLAKEFFESAFEMNERHLVTINNMLIVLDILDKHNSGYNLWKKSQGMERSPLEKQRSQVLASNLLFHLDRESEAIDLLESLLQETPFEHLRIAALKSLAIFKKQRGAIDERIVPKPQWVETEIRNIDLYEFDGFSQTMLIAEGLEIKYADIGESTIVQVRGNGKRLGLHWTNSAPTNNPPLKHGMSFAEIKNLYPESLQYAKSSKDAVFWVVYEKGLVLKIDGQNTLQEWCVFLE